jgi:hypothetical protein
MRVHNMLEVRLLHLKTKNLYDQVVAQQKLAEQSAAALLRRRNSPQLDAWREYWHMRSTIPCRLFPTCSFCWNPHQGWTIKPENIHHWR